MRKEKRHVVNDRHVRIQCIRLEHHGDVTVLGFKIRLEYANYRSFTIATEALVVSATTTACVNFVLITLFFQES